LQTQNNTKPVNKYTFTLLLSLFGPLLLAQGSEVPLGSDAYHILERLRIKTDVPPPFHPSLKYFTRGDAAKFALMLDTAQTFLTGQDRQDIFWLYKDNNEWLHLLGKSGDKPSVRQPIYEKVWTDSTKTFYVLREKPNEGGATPDDDNKYIETKKPLLKYFYHTPANFLEVNQPSFKFRLNPILNVQVGKESGREGLNFFNQRGLRFRGVIDDKVWFSASLIETQARFPEYVNQRINRDKAIPGASFYKNYQSNIFGDVNGYDFLNGQGLVGFNISPHVSMQLGHGQHFIGDGYRSLILSDFAANYFYLKLNWRIWKFHYQNLYAELSTNSNREIGSDDLLGKKYMTTHHLSYNITPKLNVGLFETVVFSRNNDFELQYLNPVIFYRVVEQMIGSPDNVIAGIDMRWDFLNRFSLYGQLVMDEFKFDELFLNRNKWWANKYGVQVGAKYIDMFGIDHLDGQVEFNLVRPYTYTHRDSSASYANYNQSLAHPLGANFKETVFIGRYRPIKKLTLEGRLLYAMYGEDTATENYGNNILLPHTTRVSDYGNVIGQGVKAKQLTIGLDASYQIWHNMYVELHYLYRNKNSEDASRSLKSSIIGTGIRMNIANRPNDF
jgi:hypothetical protein